MRIGLNGWFLDQRHVGSGQYAYHLQRALLAQDVACLTFRPQGGDVDVPLRSLGDNLAKVWYEQIDLPRMARGQVALLHYPYFAAPLFKRCPTVVSILDLIPLLMPEYSRSPQVMLYNALICRAARRADAVIVLAEHTAQDVVRHLRIPRGRIHVVYAAPDPRCRAPEPAVVEDTKRRYGLRDYVYYIGGLNRHKNIAVLLAAFAQVRRRLPGSYQLAIAGKAHSANPTIFPDPRPAAEDAGLTWSDEPSPWADVRFLGFVREEDKPALYRGAELFVFPSSYEGFGFTPLEAMACGVPVVSSRAASLAEVVGDGGILVEPTDVRGLADALVAVLGDPNCADDLRARGLRQAARFSWDKAARETIAVYTSVLRQPIVMST